MTTEVLWIAATLVPIFSLFVWIGILNHSYVPESAFQKIVLVLVAAGGISALFGK